MRGFTLVEVIIALLLAAIVCFIAIPSLRQYGSQTTDTVAQSQLLQVIQRAQQTANAKMKSMALCPSRDGKTCVSDDANMVILFTDNHNDGVIHDDAQLVSGVFLQGSGSLYLRSYPAYRDYLLMLPLALGSSDNGTFWYCSNDHVFQWAVTVSQSGEAHVVTSATEGGFLNAPGKRMEC